MSAEFEALMGKNSNLLSFILVTYTLPTKQIQSSGMDISKDNEAAASGPSFPEIPFLS